MRKREATTSPVRNTERPESRLGSGRGEMPVAPSSLAWVGSSSSGGGDGGSSLTGAQYTRGGHWTLGRQPSSSRAAGELSSHVFEAHLRHGGARAQEILAHLRRRPPARSRSPRCRETRLERSEESRGQDRFEVLEGRAAHIRVVGLEGSRGDARRLALQREGQEIEDVLEGQEGIAVGGQLALDGGQGDLRDSRTARGGRRSGTRSARPQRRRSSKLGAESVCTRPSRAMVDGQDLSARGSRRRTTSGVAGSRSASTSWPAARVPKAARAVPTGRSTSRRASSGMRAPISSGIGQGPAERGADAAQVARTQVGDGGHNGIAGHGRRGGSAACAERAQHGGAVEPGQALRHREVATASTAPPVEVAALAAGALPRARSRIPLGAGGRRRTRPRPRECWRRSPPPARRAGRGGSAAGSARRPRSCRGNPRPRR